MYLEHYHSTSVEESKMLKDDPLTCDIFDFMSDHIGLTILHPGGLKSTLELLALCNLSSESKVLDIACGKGKTTFLVAEKYGCSVLGMDINEQYINRCKMISHKKGMDNQVSFIKGDAQEIPLEDNTIDVAITQAVLVLVNKRTKAIQEALRVLKPGGILAYIEPAWKKEPERKWFDLLNNHLRAYCMTRMLTFKDWEKLFYEAGVKDLTIYPKDFQFGGFSQMRQEEGMINTLKIIKKFLFYPGLRQRMKNQRAFFYENSEMVGYGLFIARK